MGDSVIAFDGVTAFVGGKEVLRDISWRVGKGENWAVVGPNGSGKTTLLKMVGGYHWPKKGKIEVLGRAFGRSDLRELRRTIGMVSSYVTDRVPREQRVLDVVTSGIYSSIRLWKTPTERDTKLAASLLDLVGCAPHAGRTFGELSQGEQQKVVIARALASNPVLLMLDEPCNGLDLRSREEFLDGLTRAAARTSMLYVTHRIEEIPAGFTHAMLIRDGSVVASGDIAKTLNGRNMTRCFGVGVRVRRHGGRFSAIV
ncbi:MAG: ABC transporter ATP-binding protein [Nitrososphaerota archaeon]|nr:ABC transporter ATP-binding protein [Nitrososphaerota archaeon]